MTDLVLVRLSWPPKPLWQNVKSHWAKKAKAVASHKTEAYNLSLAARELGTEEPILRFTFHPQKKGRLPDLHNMPATMKAAIDGIALAMGCDDAKFRCIWPEEFGHRVEGGCVLIEITKEEKP